METFGTLFCGPTDAQMARMKRAEKVETDYMKWLHDRNHDVTLEECTAKYNQLKADMLSGK